jgi:hypothetical protein
VQAAFQTWLTPEVGDADAWEQLFLLRESLSQGERLRVGVNHVLEQCLTEVAQAHPRHAQAVRLRFIANRPVKEVRPEFFAEMTTDFFNRFQREALAHVAEMLCHREMLMRTSHAQYLELRLPARDYDQLFGVELLSKELTIQLVNPAAPALVVITGIGGIGKTALADFVVRQALHQRYFVKSAYLRVELNFTLEGVLRTLAHHLELEPDLPLEALRLTLRQACRTQPHLLMIDNLETVTDTTRLMTELAPLGTPSKLLFTTRARPAQFEPPATFKALDALKKKDALELLRHQAIATQQDLLSHADFEQIYQAVGGNPLALRLIVPLVKFQPLHVILADLEHAELQTVRAVYRRVYLNVWRSLSPEAQTLLKVMPLIGETGADQEQLCAVSGLSEPQFWRVLQELWERSLLETRGTPSDKRYGIHRLTEQFVKVDILQWDDDDDDTDA